MRKLAFTGLAVAMLLLTGSLSGQMICEHCYSYEFLGAGYRDASCCIAGSTWCDQLATFDNSFKWVNNASDCTVSWFEGEYICGGNSGSCTRPVGWGGDDGDPCTLRFGQLCPAQCGWCVYSY
jgi:hypothetical protein